MSGAEAGGPSYDARLNEACPPGRAYPQRRENEPWMTIAPSSWESDHAGGTVSVGEMVEIVSFLSLYILTPDGVPRMTASDQSYCRMRRQLVEEREDLAMPYPRPYALRPFYGSQPPSLRPGYLYCLDGFTTSDWLPLTSPHALTESFFASHLTVSQPLSHAIR
ncbi:hypothetical protein GCM10011504_50420 [Siccirubricoccus deserti]|nr:hypothetical protein GCM10011504_50420 [Siccirubricoccus deserti]